MTLRKLVPAALAALALSSIAFAGDLESGRALKEKGKFEEALPFLQKASDANPADAATALDLSAVLLGLGQFDRAAKCVTPAIDANPDNVDLLVAKGRAYIFSGDKMSREGGDPNMILAYIADGDKWVGRALEKDPKNSGARVLKAKVYQHQGGGDTPEALVLLEDVTKDDPKCFDAFWDLGQIWMRKGQQDNKDKSRWAAAEKYFRGAFAADPTSGQALLQATYAKQWQNTAKAPELVADYAKCAALLPGQTAPLSRIWSMKKWAAAEVKAAMRSLASAKDGDTHVQGYLALLDGEDLLAAGKVKEAVGSLATAPGAWGKTENKDIYFAVHRIARDGAGLDVEQRETLWTATWKNWPARSEVPNDAGLWYRDVGHDYKRSAAWYLRAAEAAPNSPAILNDTGLIFHYHLNEPEKAESWYRKAVQAAEDGGIDVANAGGKDLEATGFRDALNNMYKLLSAQKRWKDLKEFTEQHVPEGFPGREAWLEGGK